jgi:hypothetical protein
VTLRQALDEVANVLDSITRLNRENEIVFDKFNEVHIKSLLELLNNNYIDDVSGKFDLLVDFFIEKIDNYFNYKN